MSVTHSHLFEGCECVTRIFQNLLVSSFAVLCFVVSPIIASADYTVFQNTWGVQAVGGASDTNQVFGAGTGNDWVMKYTATSTVTLFDRLDLFMCQLGGSDGGNIYLEVRFTSTSSAILASSTLAVNDGNIPRNATCNTNTSATTTTFVLNNNLQWVSGVEVFFTIRHRQTSGSIYHTFRNMTDLPSENYKANVVGNIELYSDAPFSRLFAMSAIGRAIGSQPTNQNQGAYNASSTAVICTSFDVGCYISTAVSWAFYPTIPLSEQLSSISDTTAGVIPFGYVYSLKEVIDDAVDNATTTFAVTVELSGLMNFLGGNYASSTVTVMSGSQIRTAMGSTSWAFVQTLMQAGIWVGFIFYVYRRSIKFL